MKSSAGLRPAVSQDFILQPAQTFPKAPIDPWALATGNAYTILFKTSDPIVDADPYKLWEVPPEV